MLLHMRTSIDIPDPLMAKVKERLHRQKITFRTLVVAALEAELAKDERGAGFRLRDAAAGEPFGESGRVTSEEVNAAIDGQREPSFGR